MADHDQVKEYLFKKIGKPADLNIDWGSLAPNFASEPTPEPEPEFLFEYNTVIDSEDPDAGFVTIDDEGKITVHLYEDWSVRQWRMRQMKSQVEGGNKRFSVMQVCVLNFDPMNQRTCVWFSPGRDFVESFAAELSEHYDFDKPHELNQCAHPEIGKQAGIPTPSCISDDSMPQCSYYQPETWRKAKEIKADAGNEDTVRLVLEYTRKGSGFPVYRIRKYTNENEVPVLLDTLSAVDHKAEIHNVARQFFDGRVSELESDNVVEIEIPVEEAAPTQRYFDYVLS